MSGAQKISNKVEKVEIPNFSLHQATALMQEEGSFERGMGEAGVALSPNHDEEVAEVAEVSKNT